MSHPPRQDYPGSWHHVINRAVDHRPLFEDPSDVRLFLSRIAREVRRKRLEIHAWCAMKTHFHLLVRSPRGLLSQGMRQAQNEYSRHFNLRRGRTGALVRGRFLSVPVESLTFRRVVVQYIDANPVRAGLAKRAAQYPHGSASQYARPRGPIWLERSWIESEVVEAMGLSCYKTEHYETVFESFVPEGVSRLVEARFGQTLRNDPLDELFGASPSTFREWMIRKACMADTTPGYQPVCDASSIVRTVQLARSRQGPWNVRPNGKSRDAWEIALIGLLRDLATLSWSKLAAATGGTPASCRNRLLLHRRLLSTEESYADRIGVLGSNSLALCLEAPKSKRGT